MARYSKTALYKLQNEVHKINKPVTLSDFGRKIVEIPEAHVPMAPAEEKKPKIPVSSTFKNSSLTETKETSLTEAPKKAPAKKASAGSTTKKTSAKKSSHKKSNSMVKYSKKAGEKVEKTMHEMKQGTLRSGGSGKKVKSRKQAIAIGLSEARKAGAKVPKAPVKKSAAKKASASKRSGTKKVAPKKAAAKKRTRK